MDELGMSAWAVKDRTETWDAVCDRAWAGEPQFVSRGPSQTVVVISYVDYRPIKPQRSEKVVKKQNRLLDVLKSCPCRDDELANLIEERTEYMPSYFERTGCFDEV